MSDPATAGAAEPVAGLPWWRRWRGALLGAFLLVALVGAGHEVVEVVTDYRRVERAALERHGATAEALASATEHLVARYLGLLRATAEAAFDATLSEDRRRLLLEAVTATQPGLDSLVLVEPGGRILDAVPPDRIGASVAGSQVHRAVLDGATAIAGNFGPDRFTERLGLPIGAVARAEDGTVRGFLVARLPLDELARVLDISLGGRARAVLVDRTGRVVVHTQRPDLSWEARDVAGHEAVAAALAGRAATWDRLPSPWSGDPLLGAVRPVGSLGFALAVLEPVDAALAPARERAQWALAGVVVSLVVGVGLALLLSRRLARPVAALTAGVEALGRGNLGHRIAVRGGYEIDTLAAHVNGMAERLASALAEARALNARLLEANRELAARESEAEAASRRAAFLAEVGTRLAGTLDYEQTLAAAARLAVPDFADYCIVDLLDPGGAIRRVAAVHAEPAKAPLVRDLIRFPPDPQGRHPLVEVLRAGRAALLAEAPDAWMAGVPLDPTYLEVVRRLGARSNMIVPLVARGRVLGAITFALAESGRRYGPADLEFAGEVARRAAIAVDNARLYQEAQAAVRAREAFLARASHELRTPLTSALGTLRLASRALAGRLAEPPGALLEIADRNLATMTALINDLLDASKLAAGGDVLATETLDLADVARRSVEVVAAEARERGVTVEVTLAAAFAVVGDPLKLEQVLVNLLANAVTFTPAGGRVVVDGVREPGAAVLRVRDTGEGMAREDLERVFEPFVQVRARGARRRGTGLGLTICRQIVGLHGGRIWAESDGPGRGSTFVVRLPAGADGRPKAA